LRRGTATLTETILPTAGTVAVLTTARRTILRPSAQAPAT